MNLKLAPHLFENLFPHGHHVGLVVPRALGRLQDEFPAGRWTLAHLQLERLQLLDLFIYLKRSGGEYVKNNLIKWDWDMNLIYMKARIKKASDSKPSCG